MSMQDRRFLLLQGPHGPFMAELGAALRGAGAGVLRVAVNAGDAAEWRGPGLVRLDCPSEAYGAALARLMARERITDLVLYGETRPLHRAGLAAARAAGVATHILEEGYLRPHWVTYETEGSNAGSPACRVRLGDLPEAGPEGAVIPSASWGSLRHHMVYGAAYQLRVMVGSGRWQHWQSHRGRSLLGEAAEAAGSAAGLPLAALWRERAQARVLRGAGPLYVLLLQLEHDMALREAGALSQHAALLERVLAAFSAHAPGPARLAVKMHPLEPRRLRTARAVSGAAVRYGLRGRVAALPGGRLAPLLDGATAVLTVSSTAGQQALWRGLPLFAFAPTVYAHPELLPEPVLERFMAAPRPPDAAAYARLRGHLFATSQIRGCFYTTRGRRELIERLLPRMGVAGTEPDPGWPVAAAC